MSDVNDTGDRRGDAGQHINQADSLPDGEAGIACAFGIKPDRIPGTADHRTMQQDGINGEYQHEGE